MKSPINLYELETHYASTKAWAEWQDKVFEDPFKRPTYNEARKWIGLMEMQNFFCGANNLSIRNYLILHVVQGAQKWKRMALDQIAALKRDGYWLEGASYWQYVCAGLAWYTKVTGEALVDSRPISEAYRAIVSPDGTIPLPEVGLNKWSHDFGGAPPIVDTPAYYVKRWKDGNGSVRDYLLIAKDCDPNPVWNLHHHLVGGYFAFWRITDYPKYDHIGRLPNNGWLSTRCTPYSGFNFLESLESRSYAPLLPKGALPPLWRLKPPQVTATRHGDTFYFEWDLGLFRKAKRKIEVGENSVLVTDKPTGIFAKTTTREYRI